MCTVSFVSLNNTKVITSNRDEHINRPPAIPPVLFDTEAGKQLYPVDGKSGGSWFVATEHGAVGVVLNGAFINHIVAPAYRKSRGLILLEMMHAQDPAQFFTTIDLEQIEPFTVVLFYQKRLFELRWDGNKKYTCELDSDGNYIWSSATLYTKAIARWRQSLFNKALFKQHLNNEADIFQFHNNNNGDDQNGFVINRAFIKTVSTTQAVINNGQIQLSYYDSLTTTVHKNKMLLSNHTIFANSESY